ncbi:MAG: B12-binding domain-containing radical SAM protein [Armatimonadetes bacterium]|nr:B12-binding domain-containing radical SAM protein [Armatimonadota bacterium]MDE2206105.1 B12-binding domain-containing radical SAM protein [Armatimonadota bacterium]
MKRFSKIVLVEPRAPGYHVYSRVALPRLGLPQLAAILRRAGYTDITIYCEDLAPVNVEDVCSADFVGISTTTSTAMAAYKLGALVKQRNPKAVVAIGGVHVTFMPEEPFDGEFCARWGIQQPVCDHVIQGEAEHLIVPLLQAWEDGEPPERVLGTTLRTSFSERIDASKSVQDIDSLPFPELTSIVGRERMKVAPIVTSRGCPFDCTFCSVIEMFSQKMRYRSIDPADPQSVISEMKQLHLNRISSVFFYDDNFNAYNKRTKQLLENMIRADVVPRAWTAQVRATEIVRDRELLELMLRTNCHMLYLGLESVNQATLDEYNKKQSVEQIVDAIRILKEYGIRAHGMFVFGADGDTPDVLRHTADFAIRNDISTVQFMILTPLPGTRYFQQLHDQGRIFDYDWNRYDAHHTVYWPKNMSPYELQRETFDAMRRVYRMGRVVRPIFQGNVLSAFFRMYGHNLIRKHDMKTADYLPTLPKTVMPEASWIEAEPVKPVAITVKAKAEGLREPVST